MKLKNIKLDDILDPKKQQELVAEYVSHRPSLIKKALDARIDQFIGQVVYNMTNSKAYKRNSSNAVAVDTHERLVSIVEQKLPEAFDNLIGTEEFDKVLLSSIEKNIKEHISWCHFDIGSYVQAIVRERVNEHYEAKIKEALANYDLTSVVDKAVSELIRRLN